MRTVKSCESYVTCKVCKRDVRLLDHKNKLQLGNHTTNGHFNGPRCSGARTDKFDISTLDVRPVEYLAIKVF